VTINKTFGDAIDIFDTGGKPPMGIETVATTFTNGPPILDGCPIHGIGCPSNCPVLAAAKDFERNPPPPCRPTKTRTEEED
jgi:hypothetical protein